MVNLAMEAVSPIIFCLINMAGFGSKIDTAAKFVATVARNESTSTAKQQFERSLRKAKTRLWLMDNSRCKASTPYKVEYRASLGGVV